MWLEVWTKTAANEITVLPTKPSLRAARAGCPLSRHSRASHAAITPQMRALERLSTACAHFPCHTVPPAPCSAIRKAVGVQAARKPSKDTGRMSTSGFGDTTDTWHYVRPADFSTSYQSNVKLLIRGLRPKPYRGPVTGGIGRSGRVSPSPPPSVRRWVSMVSGSRTNGDAFGMGPRMPLLRCLSTSSLSRL
jgi:hypothetical protein